MKNLFFIILSLSLWSFSNKIIGFEINTIQGTWIEESFQETLLNTGSPMAAAIAAPTYSLIEIRNLNEIQDGYFVGTLRTNFHEAGALPESSKFTQINNNTLEVTIDSNLYRFHKINLPIDYYININSIAGVYKDNKGNLFDFSVTGNLFINKKFAGTYEIFKDLTFNEHLIDCFNLYPTKNSFTIMKKTHVFFSTEKKWLTYTFAHTESGLMIYRANIENEDIITKNTSPPLKILKRIKSHRL